MQIASSINKRNRLTNKDSHCSSCYISIVTVAVVMILFNKEYVWERFVSRKGFLYANATPPLSSFMTVENVENLKLGQKRLTEMLRVFDEICMKNSVEYFVIGGTLLGAFAYEGWIPWDGDIDVEILKSDWPKLEKLLMSDLPDTMWLQTEKTDKHYRSWLPNFVMGKVRDLNSCYHRCQDGTRFHNGFMVDLYAATPHQNKPAIESSPAKPSTSTSLSAS